MIITIVKISLLRLWHNKSELLLTFVVPVVFFSIFAMIFGSRERSGSTSRVKVVLADLAFTKQSAEVIAQLRDQETFRFIDASGQPTEDGTIELLEEGDACRLVEQGSASAAIVFRVNRKKGPSNAADQPQISAEILTDSSDQIAAQVVQAIVQKSLVKVYMDELKKAPNAPPSPVTDPPASAERPTESPSAAANNTLTSLSTPAPPTLAAAVIPGNTNPIQLDIPETTVRDLVGGKKKNPIVAMYAAGIAVMFLLFSVTGGSGSLLEEKESSTLERLLASQLTMDQLLMGKWLYLTLLGVVQTTVMFLWGQLIFGVELLTHLDGFFLMTMVTAGAASSFALFLATLCGTRAQLNWISIVLVLGMSALGGSMVPRYLMSEQIREIGLFTFNAWALDGYNKVFWRDMPVDTLWPQLLVLTLSGLIFIVAARISARRWEKV